ncbi:trigger factor [bacterium]|nr:MAG: trigger factor [bacterium]
MSGGFMAVSIERPEPSVIIVKGEYSPDEVASKLNEMVNNYAGQIQIPGFRRGKAPKSMILARYGDSLKQDLSRELLAEIVQEAIEKVPELENALYTDEPKIEKIEEGKPFSVQIYAEIVPQFELKKYQDFEITREEVPVDDKEIDSVIEDILMRNSSLEERHRPATENDFVKIEFSEADQEPIPMLVPLDDPEFFQFFAELVGKSSDDTLQIEAQFPDGFPDRRLRGKTGKFNIKVVKVMEQVKPKLDSEFFKKMGKPEEYNEHDFRKEVREYIGQQKSRQADDVVKSKLIDAIVEANPVPVPEKYFQSRMNDYINEQWDTSKIEPEKLDELKQQIASYIRKQIQYEFIVDKIVEQEKIDVDDQEVINTARGVISSMGYSPDAAEQVFKPQTEQFENLRKRIKRDKALELVLSRSKIIAKTPDETPQGKENSNADKNQDSGESNSP